VATDAEEVGRLEELLRRGTQNGLRGLRRLSREELREIEPHAGGIAGVFVPEEGIVDYDAVCKKLQAGIERAGGEIRTGSRVTGIREGGSGWTIESTSGAYEAGYLVNCAGLFSDRVAQLAGVRRKVRIVPFRGEYYTLGPRASGLVRNLIYPVPDPTFPFLGVHFTRMIHGGVEAGPNAVLAFAREGYSWWNFSARDLADSLSFAGLWRFLGRHRSMCWEEMVRSLSKRKFCQSLQKLVPDVQVSDLGHGGSGVRAQAMHVDGTFIQDFWLEERPRAMHVLNAPSPAATAAISIAREIVARIPRDA
jgi:L-2-hydroxyglutarate oxidase